MTDEAQEKPKIIIDEDWKSQVEEERELFKKGEGQPDAGETPGDEAGPGIELPPASFPFLVTSIATQAMAAMGQLPDLVEGKPVLHVELARHHIDTLSILQEKTQGNLTSEEAAMLEDVLHQLRMLFVAVQQQPTSE